MGRLQGQKQLRRQCYKRFTAVRDAVRCWRRPKFTSIAYTASSDYGRNNIITFKFRGIAYIVSIDYGRNIFYNIDYW